MLNQEFKKSAQFPMFPLHEKKLNGDKETIKLKLATSVKVTRKVNEEFTEILTLPVLTEDSFKREVFEKDPEECEKSLIGRHLKHCLRQAKFFVVPDNPTYELTESPYYMHPHAVVKTDNLLMHY